MKEDAGDGAATTSPGTSTCSAPRPAPTPAKVNLSGLTADQDFSSPDGLWFSPQTGLCWIQTDDGAYTDVTNCMMLAAMPGKVGDGGTLTLTYTKADGSTVTVRHARGREADGGHAASRFLVGPKDCEITGIAETPDGKTMFVNIQHPGETISRPTSPTRPSTSATGPAMPATAPAAQRRVRVRPRS